MKRHIYTLVTRHIMFLYDCKSYKDRVKFEEFLTKSGAEIIDYKINYKAESVKYYIYLNPINGGNKEKFEKTLKTSLFSAKTSLS